MKSHSLSRLSACVAIIAGTIALSPVAIAGSNGQHIELYVGQDTNSVEIAGENQLGGEVHQILNTPSSPTRDASAWWKYTVEITSYTGINATGTDEGTAYCDVPVSQSGNWYDCYGY